MVDRFDSDLLLLVRIDDGVHGIGACGELEGVKACGGNALDSKARGNKGDVTRPRDAR